MGKTRITSTRKNLLRPIHKISNANIVFSKRKGGAYIAKVLVLYYYLCYNLLTQVNPRHPIASANMSPSREGNEFRAGK